MQAAIKKNTPLKNLLNQNEFRRIISYKKLKSLPIGTHLSSEELTEELFAKNLPQSKDELYAQLLANTKEDFKYGRTVEIDGWIFSKTVAEFSLLQYKMFGNQS